MKEVFLREKNSRIGSDDMNEEKDEKEKTWMMIQRRMAEDMLKRMYIVIYEILKVLKRNI